MLKAVCSISRLLTMMLILLAGAPVFAQTAKPLVIFLVHGLGGDAKTFGDMPALLQSELGAGRRLIIQPLTYQTDSPTKIQREFVNEIAVQMARTYQQNGLNPDTDPFAFVVHSQGGIIARNYFIHCIQQPACDRQGQPRVPKHPVLLFTMGTPHWGSPMGNKVSDGSQLGQLLAWAGGRLYAQYKQLSIGSTMMYNDRATVIRLAPEWNSQGYKFFMPGLRFVSVAGNVAHDLDRFSAPVRHLMQQLFLDDVNEDDVIVPTTHANPDFHYYLEKEDLQGQRESQEGDVHLADESYLVRLPHTDFASSEANRFFEGIARPRSTAEHASLLYLLRELARHHIPNEAKARAYDQRLQKILANQKVHAEKVREFSSEVIIAMPLGYQRKPELPVEKDITSFIHIRQSMGSLFNEGVIENLSVRNSVAFKTYGLNSADYEQVNKPYFAFFHSGRFSEEDASTFGNPEKRARICYTLSFPGFRSKDFCTTVRPGEASFAKVILEPYQPIPEAKAFANTPRLLREGWLVIGYDRKAGRAAVVSTDGRGQMQVREDAQLRAQGLGGADFEELEQQCAVVQVGPKVGIHTGGHFNGPVTVLASGQFEPGQRLEVIGRYSDKSKGYDRYLLRAKQNFEWVNAADVDVIEGERCGGSSFWR